MAGPLATLSNRAPVPYKARGMAFELTRSASASLGSQLATMEGVSTMFSIVDLIASKVASVDWHLYRKADRPEDRVEIFDHPALVVWENPATVDGQVIYSQDELIEASQQHYELTGELWQVLETRSLGSLSGVTGIWPVSPDRMAPVKDRTNFLAGYQYTIGQEKIPLRIDQVIFDKRQNPRDPWRGLSPIPSLMLDIEGEKAAAAWNYNFFANGALPGGVLELDRETLMDDAEWEEWVDRWRAQHQGVSNAHRIAVMEMGSFTERATTQKDMEFTGLRTFSRESMMEAYRVSKANLGHVDDVNRANDLGQRANLATNILIPRLERWRKLLNVKFLPRFGPRLSDEYEFDFDDPTPVDAGDQRLAKRADVLNARTLLELGSNWEQTLEAFGLPSLSRDFIPPKLGGESDSSQQSEPINVEPGTVDEPGSAGGSAPAAQ